VLLLGSLMLEIRYIANGYWRVKDQLMCVCARAHARGELRTIHVCQMSCSWMCMYDSWSSGSAVRIYKSWRLLRVVTP